MLNVIRLIDPPVTLLDNQTLFGEEFVLERTQFGRFIFTESTAIQVLGNNITISNCKIRLC